MAVDLVDLNAVLKAQVLEQRFERFHLCAAVIELWAPFLADAAHEGNAQPTGGTVVPTPAPAAAE